MELIKYLSKNNPQLLEAARDQYRNFGSVSFWTEMQVASLSKNWKLDRPIFIEKIAKTAK
ncbi:MAG: hypothetical protein J6M60_07165 [Clostridia bacterium]|nr:hypothetical protein [Clostridia bacterium]